ncbi:MAG: hypothetical protein LBV50_01595 [Novosphingobium sp.]|nr:hypothetical protein [Novosphingobium sp.]
MIGFVKWIGIAALAFSAGAYGGAPGGKVLHPAIIPLAFQGEWNAPLAACEPGSDAFNDDLRLRIQPRVISFYASEGVVRRVFRHNEREITVLGTYSGEGRVDDQVDRFVLSRSGNELTIRTGQDQGGTTRYRCPSKSSAADARR